MTLGQKQERFARCLPQLLDFIHSEGFEVRMGDAFRDPRTFGEQGVAKGYGRAFSAHKNKLAQDINLCRGGKYLTATKDHAQFGQYWKTLFDDCRWGGDFPGDANHYSIEHNGVT